MRTLKEILEYRPKFIVTATINLEAESKLTYSIYNPIIIQ